MIGGSDPSGGAGIQADLLTLQTLGLQGLSVVTAVTAQNENRFFSAQTVSIKNFKSQLESIRSLSRGGIIKIGMLGKGELIAPLIQWLLQVKPCWILLDPIFFSSTSFPLLDRSGTKKLKTQLISQIDLMTPNLDEAAFLSGISITDRSSMLKSAQTLLDQHSSNSRLKAVFLKGGHLPGEPHDLLLTRDRAVWFKGKRIAGKRVHGTGCTLSSAIAGYLCLGKGLRQAIALGRRKVRKKILNQSSNQKPLS